MARLRMLIAILIAGSLNLAPVLPARAMEVQVVTASDAGVDEIPCCAPDDCKLHVVCGAQCLNCDIFVVAEDNGPQESSEIRLVAGGQRRLHAHVQSPPTHPPPLFRRG